MVMLISSVKAQVTQALDTLSEAELQQVAEYVTFLRFRPRVVPPSTFDPIELGALYAPFTEENHALAEEGLELYRAQLHDEDSQ